MDLAAEHESAETAYAAQYKLDGSDPRDQYYLDDRWRGANPEEPGLVSAGSVAAARLRLPPMPVAGVIDLVASWSEGAARREVSLGLNGEPFATFAAPERTRQRFMIPRELVKIGVNELEVECRGATSFRVLELVVGDEDTVSARGSWVEATAGTPTVMQRPGAHLAYFVRPPNGAALRFRLPDSAGRASYAVRIQRMGAHEEVAFAGRSGDGEVEVPLGGLPGEPLRVGFAVTGPGGPDGREPRAYPWEAPRIVASLRPRSSQPRALPDQGPPSQALPNLVVYVIDALRADHLQTYGYPRETSPAISAFSQDAIVFERAYAQSVWTRPTVGSLLTGLYPDQHLAVNDVAHLSDSVMLVTSHLRRRGYTSLGLQANSNAGAYFGFGRDFDTFVDPAARRGLAPDPPSPSARAGSKRDRSSGPSAQSRSSERSLQQLVRLSDRLQEPFFLFIQTIDPHDPYEPPPAFRALVNGHTIPGLSGGDALRRFLALPEGALRSNHGRRLRRHLKSLYDAEIRHNDHYFGQTLEFLRHRGLYENTLVLLTADHGEAFREHGYDAYHSAFYENTIRVPLIVKPPFAKGQVRVTEPVQHIDVVPTLLDLAGSPSSGLPGRSLLATAAAEGGHPPRTVHAVRYRDIEIPRYRREGRAVVSWPWKLIQDDIWAPHLEVYDLLEDPRERRNLWPGTDPVLLGFLLREADRLPMRLDRVYQGRRMTDEAEEALRALGYVQ